MKNACLLIGEGVDALTFPLRKFTALIESGGYEVEETRILSVKTPDTVKAALIDLKSGYDNVFLFSPSSLLSKLRGLLEEAFSRNCFQGGEKGLGAYTEEGKSLFLVSDGERGEEYLRGVCLPYLDEKYASKHAKFTLRAVGADPTTLARLLAQGEGLGGGLRFLHRRLYGEDVVEIVYDQNAPRMLTDEVLRLFAEGLGESLYALDDTPLEEQLVALLKLRGKKLAVAESFTGGGVGRRVVSVAGASKVFSEGLNTYSEASKIKRLGVSEYTLNSYGAVSKETAYEMAAGLLSSGAQVAIATTGLAGPESDSSGLPVGVCCIAIGIEDKVFVSRYKLSGDRTEITETAINYALFLACKQLKKM
ncbi:MAG: CinA family protein [Clostridia bacterium]|nr:CinA family protein [Clostridia bacterium]